jgi:hypothetical protein
LLLTLNLSSRPGRLLESGEVVRGRRKYLGPKGLQLGAPGIARQGGLERADALRRDDWNALGPAGKTEESFISSRLSLAYGSEMVVLVAAEKHLPEITLWLRFNLRDAIKAQPARTRA